MLKHFKKFSADESGAVTVDWVVLTAAIVGLGIAVLAAVSDEMATVAGNIGDDMAAQINAGTDGSGYTATAPAE